MKLFAAAFALAFLAAAPAMPPALAQALAQGLAQAPAPVCQKPATPVFPAPAAAAALTAADFAQQRAARDAYMTAADQTLACLDADIEARMRTLFATGAPMDGALRAQGLAHEQASRERAETHEKFLRLCLAYEDAHGPAGCR